MSVRDLFWRGASRIVRLCRIERKVDGAVGELKEARRDLAEVLRRLSALKIGQIALERKVNKMADTLEDVKAKADAIDAAVDKLQTEVGEEIVILKDLATKVGGAVDQPARDALVAQMQATADRIQSSVDALDVAGNEAEPPPAPPVEG